MVAFITDEAPTMSCECTDINSLCHDDAEFPDVLNYYRVIHQQALAGRVPDFSHAMTLVLKLINSICAKGLQHSLFKGLLEEAAAAY